MVVADGLTPVGHQGICNHRDGVSRSAWIRSDQCNDQPLWSLFCSVKTVLRSSTCNIQVSPVLAHHARRYVGRGIVLTRLPWTKWPLIRRIHIQMHFREIIPRVGFQAAWNLFMTRRVINCHKLYPKPVNTTSFRMFGIVMIMTHKYDKQHFIDKITYCKIFETQF